MTEPVPLSNMFDALLSCVECGQAELECVANRYRCAACGAGYETIDGVASFFRKDAAVAGQDSDRMEFWPSSAKHFAKCWQRNDILR
jgi:hypothetical protein